MFEKADWVNSQASQRKNLFEIRSTKGGSVYRSAVEILEYYASKDYPFLSFRLNFDLL